MNATKAKAPNPARIVTTVEIEALAAEGKTRRQIAAALGLTSGQIAGVFNRLDKGGLRLAATPEDIRWLRELGMAKRRTPEAEAAALLADLRADDEAEEAKSRPSAKPRRRAAG